MKTIHNKLVRDKIPDIISSRGEVAEIRTLDDDHEFLNELCKKIIEEAHEVAANPSVDELADVLEVVRATGKRLGYSMQDIENARVKKAEARGGFDERIYLMSTSE